MLIKKKTSKEVESIARAEAKQETDLAYREWMSDFGSSYTPEQKKEWKKKTYDDYYQHFLKEYS